MPSCSLANLRRCQPWLGTYVEIQASGLPPDRQQQAVDAAFAAVARVHGQCSVHDPSSELSRLNDRAAAHAICVSRSLFSLLERGLKLARESDGAFDFTVGPLLARWGIRPRALARSRPGNWRHLLLLSRRRVRLARPLSIDLGGIAKGYAVDAAIRVLQAAGATSATVNAGGDLRGFGPGPMAVQVRHPVFLHPLAFRFEFQDAALATSSPCFTQRTWRGRAISHLINPRTLSAVTEPISITVRAPECWLADALTKVVAVSPTDAVSLLARHRAEAFVLAV